MVGCVLSQLKPRIRHLNINIHLNIKILCINVMAL